MREAQTLIASYSIVVYHGDAAIKTRNFVSLTIDRKAGGGTPPAASTRSSGMRRGCGRQRSASNRENGNSARGTRMEAKLTSADLREHLTITLTVPRSVRARMALGLWLVRLGVRVFGARLEVVQGDGLRQQRGEPTDADF